MWEDFLCWFGSKLSVETLDTTIGGTISKSDPCIQLLTVV